jgi:hypothetical protein
MATNVILVVKKETNNVSFFPSMNGKINIFIKIFLNMKKISKILLNMYVVVVKGYILNIKFLLYQNHILKNSLMNSKMEFFFKDVLICKSCKRKFDIGKPFDLTL